MKRTSLLLMIAGMVLMWSCRTGGNTSVTSTDIPENILNTDWVHAYWITPEPQRIYIPENPDEIRERITDGFRINDDSVYLQYKYGDNGERSTEIGNWIWLPEKRTIQISFENDKEALNFKIISVEPERLEVEVVPDDD